MYNERHETPVTRMATAAIIRENLSKALEYGEKLDRAEEDEDEERPDFDPKLEALLPVVRGELPVHIHGPPADDIATGVRIAKEFHLKCVIVHGTEGHLLPELLAAEGIPVITGPSLGDRSKPELRNMTIENPAKLAGAGWTSPSAPTTRRPPCSICPCAPPCGEGRTRREQAWPPSPSGPPASRASRTGWVP